MEIINGVRFADANEPARRFAARINAYAAVGNPPGRRARRALTKLSSAITGGPAARPRGKFARYAGG